MHFQAVKKHPFKLALSIYILRSRVPVSTAPSVISYGFHTTPGQTAKNYPRKM